MKMTPAIVAISTFVAAASAYAADIPRRSEASPPPPAFAPPPLFTWTGLYLGVNAGYGIGRFSAGGDALFGKANGGVAGGTVGYNKQFGSIVLGVEGDWNWSGVKGSNTLPGPAFASAHLTNMVTLRGRAGYAVDHALFYVTGGYAGGKVQSSLIDATLPPGAQAFSTSNWNNGYAVGGGLEYAFSRNISIKGEYLYSGLSSKPIFAAPRLSDTGMRQNLLRAGVNYRF